MSFVHHLYIQATPDEVVDPSLDDVLNSVRMLRESNAATPSVVLVGGDNNCQAFVFFLPGLGYHVVAAFPDDLDNHVLLDRSRGDEWIETYIDQDLRTVPMFVFVNDELIIEKAITAFYENGGRATGVDWGLDSDLRRGRSSE